MTRNLKAVYENGVFRPLEPVPFKRVVKNNLVFLPGGESCSSIAVVPCFA